MPEISSLLVVGAEQPYHRPLVHRLKSWSERVDQIETADDAVRRLKALDYQLVLAAGRTPRDRRPRTSGSAIRESHSYAPSDTGQLTRCRHVDIFGPCALAKPRPKLLRAVIGRVPRGPMGRMHPPSH